MKRAPASVIHVLAPMPQSCLERVVEYSERCEDSGGLLLRGVPVRKLLSFRASNIGVVVGSALRHLARENTWDKVVVPSQIARSLVNTAGQFFASFPKRKECPTRELLNMRFYNSPIAQVQYNAFP